MTKRSLIYHHESLILAVQEALAEAIEKSGLTRAAVARRLGKNRSFVTQALSSGRNLTLESITKIAHVCGFDVTIRLVEPRR